MKFILFLAIFVCIVGLIDTYCYLTASNSTDIDLCGKTDVLEADYALFGFNFTSNYSSFIQEINVRYSKINWCKFSTILKSVEYLRISHSVIDVNCNNESLNNQHLSVKNVYFLNVTDIPSIQHLPIMDYLEIINCSVKLIDVNNMNISGITVSSNSILENILMKNSKFSFINITNNKMLENLNVDKIDGLNLRNVHLYGNSLKRIPYFSKLCLLEILDISDNYLIELNLSNCDIERLLGRRNKLEKVSLKNVQYLDLSINRLKSLIIPINLKEAILNENNLQPFTIQSQSEFDLKETLKENYCEENWKHVTKVCRINRKTQLERLNLSFNNIKNISLEFLTDSYPRLKNLRLEGNPIETVEKGEFLVNVSLSSDNLQCSCENYWLLFHPEVEFMYDSKTYFTDLCVVNRSENLGVKAECNQNYCYCDSSLESSCILGVEGNFSDKARRVWKRKVKIPNAQGIICNVGGLYNKNGTIFMEEKTITANLVKEFTTSATTKQLTTVNMTIRPTSITEKSLECQEMNRYTCTIIIASLSCILVISTGIYISAWIYYSKRCGQLKSELIAAQERKVKLRNRLESFKSASRRTYGSQVFSDIDENGCAENDNNDSFKKSAKKTRTNITRSNWYAERPSTFDNNTNTDKTALFTQSSLATYKNPKIFLPEQHLGNRALAEQNSAKL